jgi:hypothetical protein
MVLVQKKNFLHAKYFDHWPVLMYVLFLFASTLTWALFRSQLVSYDLNNYHRLEIVCFVSISRPSCLKPLPPPFSATIVNFTIHFSFSLTLVDSGQTCFI